MPAQSQTASFEFPAGHPRESQAVTPFRPPRPTAAALQEQQQQQQQRRPPAPVPSAAPPQQPQLRGELAVGVANSTVAEVPGEDSVVAAAASLGGWMSRGGSGLAAGQDAGRRQHSVADVQPPGRTEGRLAWPPRPLPPLRVARGNTDAAPGVRAASVFVGRGSDGPAHTALPAGGVAQPASLRPRAPAQRSAAAAGFRVGSLAAPSATQLGQPFPARRLQMPRAASAADAAAQQQHGDAARQQQGDAAFGPMQPRRACSAACSSCFAAPCLCVCSCLHSCLHRCSAHVFAWSLRQCFA
jgi:hypothetical protein